MFRTTPTRIVPILAAAVLVASGSPPSIKAQDACFQPTYRLKCETILEPQTVQKYRIEYETEYLTEQVTSYRPVLKTRTEEREVRVAKPVVETSMREEKYTVWKPVTETSYRDETVTRTRYVTETAEREEQVTTYRPVVETSYRQRQYTVQRPVVETQYREQQYTVQRPVVETQMQTQQYTTMRPVTTMENQTVDAGGYVAQQVVTPGQTTMGLQYVRGAYATPGPLGIFARVRGAYYWTPQVTPPTVQTQMAYRPNLVTQQVARTSYVPETQQVQVPVQVQRMQTEVVSQRVPVQVQRMESEVVTENIPVQTTRMVPTTEVRKIPYTVQRPVTETSTRQIPVQTQRWVAQEMVRKVPVKTTRMTYETRKEPSTVQYCEQEAVTREVKRPVTRRKYVPYTETVMVPRRVVQRVPLSYYDPFSTAIVSGYSSFSAPVTSSVITQPAIESSGPSVMEKPATSEESSDDSPKTRLQKVEVELEPPAPPAPEEEGSEDDQAESASDAEQRSGQNGSDSASEASGDAKVDPADEEPLPEPNLNKASGAGWKTRWNPVYAHEV